MQKELFNITSSFNITIDLNLTGTACDKNCELIVNREELLFYSLFSNLLKNSVKASPEGERIDVAIEPGDRITVAISNKGEVPKEIRGKFPVSSDSQTIFSPLS